MKSAKTFAARPEFLFCSLNPLLFFIFLLMSSLSRLLALPHKGILDMQRFYEKSTIWWKKCDKNDVRSVPIEGTTCTCVHRRGEGVWRWQSLRHFWLNLYTSHVCLVSLPLMNSLESPRYISYKLHLSLNMQDVVAESQLYKIAKSTQAQPLN